MAHKAILLAIVSIPILGSALMPLLGKLSERLRNAAALACVTASLAGTLILLPALGRGETITFARHLPLGFDFILRADLLAAFMAITSSLIGAVIVFYSFTYISHYGNRNEYYFLVTLFLGAMMGLVFSENLIFLYVFWEITAITSWRLIGFFREPEYVARADKAFLVTVAGALTMLIGFLMLFQASGSFDIATIKQSFADRAIPNIAVALILVGILAKSATLPLHTWLPDAGIAPSPVTALLHAAVLVKIGVYVFARLFIASFTIAAVWSTAVPVIAAVSALVSAGAALVATDMKRVIAYSTVSQIAFIFLGLAVGGEVGVAGGLLYIMFHGIAKGGLFLSAGIVEQNTGTKDITKMGGLMRTMPLTAVSFALCSFSVMGLPPLGGFFCKYFVFAGAVSTGHYLISMTFLFGALLTILYLMRLFTMVFLGEERMPAAREGSLSMVASVVMLAVLTLATGILIGGPSAFARAAAKQMLGS